MTVDIPNRRLHAVALENIEQRSITLHPSSDIDLGGKLLLRLNPPIEQTY